VVPHLVAERAKASLQQALAVIQGDLPWDERVAQASHEEHQILSLKNFLPQKWQPQLRHLQMMGVAE